MSSRLLPLSLVVILGCATGAARADVPAPPPPATYDVEIRYRIDAFRNERITQFFEMMRYLKSAGFERDPDEEVPANEAEDAKATRLHGFIASANARKLLGERHVKAIRLLPKGAKLPEDKTQPVRVHLELSSGLSPARQHLLEEQTRQALTALEFREGVAYDDRGHSRLVGSVPVGQLDNLLNDLRRQPSGEKLPPPFQNVTPIRVVEVLPEMALPEPRPKPPVVPKEQEKITADLREVLANKGAADAAARMEVILANTPGADERGWQRALKRAAPDLVIEGRLGGLVTVLGPAKLAPALAALPEVAAVRLARAAKLQFQPAGKDDKESFLPPADLERLQKLGQGGRGVRVAVVDGDFRGWEKLLGKETRLVDLTRERNRDLQADSFPGPADQPGHGTRCALAVLRAAPEAELTLIRIDPAAPYLLEAAARAINGDPYRTLGIAQRSADLAEDRAELDYRRDKLLEERRSVLDNFEQEGEAAKRREAYKKKQADFDRDERAYYERVNRFLQLQRDVAGLKGVRIVASPLVWPEGHPVDGGSPLSRYFDDRPFRGALWFQSAGDTRGQAWAGLFHDDDGNGVMEFAPPDATLPTGAWSRELNFLAWRPAGGATSRDLPAGTKIRASLQWREAHDPAFFQPGDDAFREPLAKLRLVVVHQLDPAGAKRPADDVVIVAESAGLPQRLVNGPTAATYEQTVEFSVAQPGRYALRVEGRPPQGIRPPDAPTLPFARTFGELRPRLFVETLGGNGRAVLGDFPTAVGSIGMPGDARQVLTVGAAGANGRPRSYGAEGPAFNLDLLRKPDVWAFDRMDSEAGTALATGYAAGVAAAVRGAGVPAVDWLKAVHVQPGGFLGVPALEAGR